MANKISTVRTYPLNGAVNFTITFEYLARKFVKVTLIGKDRKELVLNQDYRFTTKTQITTSRTWTAADGYQLIEIRRFTSATDRLVDFADGSILRAYDLNISQVQTLHVAEEARDLTADTIGVNNDGHLDARGRRIVNLANAVDDRDAVPFGQLKTMNQNSWQARNEALQFRNEAETFRNQAEGFKNESGTNATNTYKWRNEAEGFRNEAEQFKNTSGQYSESAGVSADSAKDSEDEARRIAAGIKAAGLIGYITRRSFEKGFNVTTWNEVLLWEEDGAYYRWDGTLPKNVPAGSTPESSGGIGLGSWVSVGDASLRYALGARGGSGLIGDSFKPATWAQFAGGVDPTGVIDSAAAFNAVYTAGEGNGIAILTPAGTYKVATNTYEVESDALWLSRDFRGGVSVVSSARSTPLNITIGTPDEPVNSGIYGRSGMNITAVARGGQHANCIRTTLDNRSTDGNGNPAVYAAGLSYSTALWTAALHGETKHGGGTTIAASIEAASYTDKGTFYGIVLNNTSGNAQLNHPTTGRPITTHPLATAMYVTGHDSRGDAGMWLRGIRFNSGSLRSGGTVLLDESNSMYGYCSASSSSKNVADILLAGTAPQGIVRYKDK